jgi:hypothetical protein
MGYGSTGSISAESTELSNVMIAISSLLPQSQMQKGVIGSEIRPLVTVD